MVLLAWHVAAREDCGGAGYVGSCSSVGGAVVWAC